MRPTRWMTLLWLAPISLLAGCTMYLAQGKVDFHETAGSEGIGKVIVETRNGSIDVRCDTNARQVDIQGSKFASGVSQEDARALAEKIQIEVRRESGPPQSLRIVAKFPEADVRNRGASFRIVVPPTVSLELVTCNGEVTVAGTRREVRVESSNDRIRISDVQGNVYARTSNGEVVASAIAGNVDVSSSNGNIQIQRAGRDRVKAETSNGRIRAIEIRGDAMVRSSNGQIELRVVSLPDRPTVKAVTTNGDVFVELPDTVNANLRMHTSNGQVHGNLKNATVKDFESSQNSHQATLNAGGGSVEIESCNGSVTLQTSPATRPAGSQEAPVK